MRKPLEIWLKIPEGHRLVGTRTEGDMVAVIYEPIQLIRPMGFAGMLVPEGEDEDEKSCSTDRKTTTRRSTTSSKR